ncbi:hypothetical protein GCM10009839_49660 [Catenulispora yoronensis]|uniref:PIG-L family deacetylase n=1 Tax=Catenulispora yoronensis TaxID=450799 RepID=A0ABN2UR29_9ACTN
MFRTLVIAAHPDEPEMYAGGTAALLAAAGHAVKFLTLTNGDAGHHELEPGPLARRRAEEAVRAADALGVTTYEIFHDISDGRLEPDVPTRLRVLHALRTWRPDLVIALHGDDAPGHADNRGTGRLVAQAVEFATVRNLDPAAPLPRQPVCLLMTDYASNPVHRPDVVIDVTPTLDAKLDACLAHASQFLEFAPFQRGLLGKVPGGVGDGAGADVAADAAADVAADVEEQRRRFVREHWEFGVPEAARPGLVARYGAERAEAVEHAEIFQFAPYGQAVDEAHLSRLLPF